MKYSKSIFVKEPDIEDDVADYNEIVRYISQVIEDNRLALKIYNTDWSGCKKLLLPYKLKIINKFDISESDYKICLLNYYRFCKEV